MELQEQACARVMAEFAEADLGDERRTARAAWIAGALARRPASSLPEAMGSVAATEAAYRFFGNGSFGFDELLWEHQERTAARARERGAVLVVHDTTTCKHAHIPAEELGFLQTGKSGFFLHASLVIDAHRHRRPLGVVHAEALFRSKRSGRGSRKRHANGAESAKWEDREFLRWFRGIEAASDRLEGVDAIHVLDREGDCYSLFAACVENERRFIVRSRLNRNLADSGKLDEALQSCDGVLERQVPLSRRNAPTAPRAKQAAPARKGRMARLRFSATSVAIARPRSASADTPLKLTLNVVHVQEVDCPPGETPVRWVLWTTEPVDTAEQVTQVVDNYRQRWLIEELFKALKTGCKYESRLLETRHALLNLLALSLPIAVELLWMRARQADEPDAPATEVLSPLQLRILGQIGPRKLPEQPTAAQALWALAGLGGHLPSNGAPGWQVLKRSYERLIAYEVGWRAALAMRGEKM
jgi:hypothetical protein